MPQILQQQLHSGKFLHQNCDQNFWNFEKGSTVQQVASQSHMLHSGHVQQWVPYVLHFTENSPDVWDQIPTCDTISSSQSLLDLDDDQKHFMRRSNKRVKMPLDDG